MHHIPVPVCGTDDTLGLSHTSNNGERHIGQEIARFNVISITAMLANPGSGIQSEMLVYNWNTELVQNWESYLCHSAVVEEARHMLFDRLFVGIVLNKHVKCAYSDLSLQLPEVWVSNGHNTRQSCNLRGSKHNDNNWQGEIRRETKT